MLQAMRDKSQSLAFKIIVGLIIFVLAIFGFGAFNAFIDQDPAAGTVNGREINQSELLRETQRQKQRILSQMGENADPSIIDEALLQSSVLEGLINRTLLLEAADDMGIAISEAQLDKLIQQNPQFQTDGKFDRVLYRRLLANNGHTPVSYKQELRNSLRLVQLNGGISETALVADWEKREIAALLSQTRDIAYLLFNSTDWIDKVEVARADVQSYYELHKADYFTEEAADAEYVELSIDQILEQIEVTEEEIAALYEQDKASLAGGERRRAAHILLEINDQRTEEQARKQLEDVKARVAAGEDFAELATELSEDPGSAGNGGDLGFVSEKGVFVPEFDRQVWSLSEGQVSEPVRTEFGMHLIKLLEIEAPKIPSLEESKERLAEQIRRSQAESLFADEVRRLDTLAFEAENSLEGVAETLKLEVKQVPGITRDQGKDVFTNAKLREALFADDVAQKGFNSPVIELDDSKAYVVRVTRLSPRRQLSLEDVSEMITQHLRNELAQQEAREAAESALAALREGAPTTEVSLRWDQTWTRIEKSKRRMPEVPQPILDAAFDLPRPGEGERALGLAQKVPTATPGSQSAEAIAVVAVTQVNDGDWDALTVAEKQGMQNQLQRRAASLDYGALFESLRVEADIETAE